MANKATEKPHKQSHAAAKKGASWQSANNTINGSDEKAD
jgi:hypothetical protein